ncbi:aldehyde dehydrogenase family protein [Actinacidiphila sp. ITFR-21]|uniref:aldehyde dehydrogenase family protein n=1 Tax=Actinacidiphila sp. ITFR-21 TaxID=3075199 RepID=UPI00288B5010|nr:aldehyde dehydrogenase family protein [Streptomyces sp. ITFR-21]WNI18738.1 aldehyde dehydrogenase family protein [Streptomyces sp. ITFR-21]
MNPAQNTHSAGTGTPHPSPLRARHLVNGEWIDTAEHDQTVDPYRGGVVTEAAVGSAEIVDRAVAAADAAASAVASLPAYRRAEILRTAADLIEERADEIGRFMSRETGKALKDSVAEVRRSQDTVRLSAEEAVRIEGEHVPLDSSAMGAGKIAFLLRVPVGVVGAITPFNAPFNLACHKLAPALAAGNAVVWKTPPQAAGVAHLLAELFVDAGVPTGALNVVHGGAEVGRAVVRDPRVSFVSFTGSSRAGASIKAESGLRRVALELGGNGQTIVHCDADIEVAAPQCARNAMRLAGQSCISVQSVLVHRSIYDPFLERLTAEVAELRVGDPLDPSTDVGTLIDEDAARRVERWTAVATSAGARLISGGGRNGAQLTPTVLADVTADMQVFCDEVFGPLVNVVAYDTLDQAFDLVNSSDYGLQTGIFTADNAITMRAIRELRTGGVVINGTSTWRTDQLAYGGVKSSGIGREGPRYAIRDMTDQRMVIFNM